MEDYLIEMRLSRAFACEFEKFWRTYPDRITPELFKSYIELKQHYEVEMEKNLS